MTLSLLVRRKGDYDLVVLGIIGTGESKGQEKRFKTTDGRPKFSKISWVLSYT